jgi:predicted esterase YcpF (UPF0227 family)
MSKNNIIPNDCKFKTIKDMKKVEVFKDSKGNLFENEREYILSEAKLQREAIIEQWKRIGEAIKIKPESYYLFIKKIGDSIIDSKKTKEDLQKQFDNVIEIFKEEMKIKTDDYNRSGKQVDYEPRLWGNDCFDGGMDTWFD